VVVGRDHWWSRRPRVQDGVHRSIAAMALGLLVLMMCWDNAAAESFWATLKVEFYDRYLWPSRMAAKLAVGDWIERVYNRRRPPPLSPGYDQPGRIRIPIHSDGISRLTLCPPNRVKPKLASTSLDNCSL
jgi:Integrase core domain